MTECCLVRDLLPLYEDKEVSAETAERIRRHLEECPECKDYYRHIRHVIRAMQHPQEISDDADHYEELLRRIHRRSQIRRAALIAVAAGAGYALYRHASDTEDQ